MSAAGRPSRRTEGKLPAFIRFPYQRVIWQQYMTDQLRRKYSKYHSNASQRGREPQDVYHYFLKEHPIVPTLESGFPRYDPAWQPVPTSEQQQAASTQEDLARELATLVIQCNPSSRNTGTIGPAISTNTTGQSSGRVRATTTPWLRSQSTSQPVQDSQLRQLAAPSQSPTISFLSDEEGLRANEQEETAAQTSPPLEHQNNIEDSWLEQDESELVLAHLETREVEPTNRPSPWLSAEHDALPITPASVSTIRSSDASSGNANDQVECDTRSSRSISSSPRIVDVSQEDLVAITTATQATAYANSGNAEEPANIVLPARSRGEHRPNPDTVQVEDVHRVIQTVTAFHCDCQSGQLQTEDAAHHDYSLRELCQDTSERRCFPLPGQTLPRPFIASSSASIDHLRTELNGFDYAQYLSTHPRHDLPRTSLRLRSTTSFAAPLKDNFYVTWDVDSCWVRLTELSDLCVPIEIAYTAQRHVNLTSPQHIPCFPSNTTIEPSLHTTAHSVFARLNVSSQGGRVYVYWPHLKDHKKTVLTDAVFEQWINGVVIPARQSLESCAWQDHPKSFGDALGKAAHRLETQISGTYGVAVVQYTLAARYLSPLAQAMREILAAVNEDSPLYPFRAFSFVVMVHDLKRAFNAHTPCFDGIAEFQRVMSHTFRSAFLSSTAFLDRSFADFGVEYNMRAQVAQPTTLLIRRACLEHRLSSAILQAGGASFQGTSPPELFTSYALHDAATGRTQLPMRSPASAVMPMIKGYSLYKHTHHSHFRHEYASPFSFPHLDLLCLSSELLHDVHKLLPGHFRHRTLENIHQTLLQTLRRLEEGQQGNASCHTGVRVEPRLSMRYLYGLLNHADHWPSTFAAAHLNDHTRHSFVIAVATADLSHYIRNFVQRMTVALGAQQFDLFGPTPAWNSIVVRHRLGTTAVLLKIMANFFEGDEHKHQYMRATKYRLKRNGRRGVVRVDEDLPVDLHPATMADTNSRVRVGLMMDAILPQYGCYWLPAELFDFEPRVQLKLHLLHRITPTRPKLLSKVPMQWRTPTNHCLTYQGDAVSSLVLRTARELARLPALAKARTEHGRYTYFRMKAWEIWKPFVALAARTFFHYVASLTDKAPFFLPLSTDEFDVPFHALTYDVVTRLLGESPVLAASRESRKGQGHDSSILTWPQRLQYIFDHRGQDQWQKTASHLLQLRQWFQVFASEGVLPCYLDLWHQDVGYLMRPFVWILPSCEKKTLFRLDGRDSRMGLAKRACTRWHLPGVAVPFNKPIIHSPRLESTISGFRIVEGRQSMVQRIHDEELERYDPFRFAAMVIEYLADRIPSIPTVKMKTEDEDLVWDRVADFQGSEDAWWIKGINSREQHHGRWVPYFATKQPFPIDAMSELHSQLREQQAQFEPEGGFHSLIEGDEDSGGTAVDDSEDDA